MGFILPEVYQSVCQENGQELPKTFVETGTFKGGIPHRVMETYKDLIVFDKYITVELGVDICKVASKRYMLFEEFNCDISKFNPHTDEKDEDFHLGKKYFAGKLTLLNNDSVYSLAQILAVEKNSICFWLDAHAGAQKYARGDVDVPLLQELDVIKEYYNGQNHIIAIDDAHLLGEVQYDSNGNFSCDYSHVPFERVEAKIKEIDSKYDVGIYDPYGMQMVIAYKK